MKTIQDLIDLIKTGRTPIVTFGKGIDQKEEIYPEPGMRGRVVSATVDKDDVAKILFEFDEFKAHNTPLESSNYYDKQGNPTLTAQAAGFYKPVDDVYFDLTEPLDGLLTVESDAAAALFETYKAESSPLTYLQWLEAKVLAS